MIEPQENQSLIKKVSIEYVDGTTDIIEDEFIVVVTNKDNDNKWNLKCSEHADLDSVLHFAYDAVDEIERASMNETIDVKKTSHLRLVKG